MLDAKELKDDELEKVTGGDGYVKAVHKDVGFAFYSNSLTNLVYKIAKVGSFLGEENGYSYEIDYYMSDFNGGHAATLCDRQIDNLVAQYGKPKDK